MLNYLGQIQAKYYFLFTASFFVCLFVFPKYLVLSVFVLLSCAWFFVLLLLLFFTLDLQLQPTAAHDSMYTTPLKTLYSTLDRKYKTPS